MRLHALLVPLVALSCRRTTAPPPAPADASHTIAVDVRTVSPDASAVASPDASADASSVDAVVTLPRWNPPPGYVARDASTPRRTTVARVTPTDANDPITLVATPTGALLVRAVNHDGRRVSELIATTLDRRGVALGEPKLLRRTTGPVRDVSADARGAHVWIAWHTVRARDEGPREEHLVAALHGNADLSTVDAPRTLADFSYVSDEEIPYGWHTPLARVFARDDGGALVVATGERIPCLHGDDEEHAERASCPAWTLSHLAPDGAVTTHREALLCPSSEPQGFVRLPGGIAYVVPDEHIGLKIVTFTEPWDSTPVTMPFEEPLWHYDNVAMAWGDGVFALRAHYAEEDPDAPATEGVWVHGPTPAQRTPALSDAYRMPVLPGITTQPLRCVEGHPVVRVRWARGGRDGVVFDPTHEGTSIDLTRWADVDRLPRPSSVTDAPEELVWAGEALVGRVHDTLLRWTCAPNGALRLATP